MSTYRFSIYSEGKLIGYSNLEYLDPSMGYASGPFVPADGYSAVEALIRLGSVAREPGAADEAQMQAYFARRDALNWQLKTAEGEVVPTLFIDIIDYFEEIGEREASMAVTEYSAFERYFERE